MEVPSTALSSASSTSSAPATVDTRSTGPSQGELRVLWLAMHLSNCFVFFSIWLVQNEPRLLWETLLGFMLVEILLVLCRKSPTISAAIYRRAFQKCLCISLGATGTLKYYTLPERLNYIASSAVPGDPSLRFGIFQFYMPMGPSSWVGCTYPNFFPSRGFFPRLIRGDEDPAGRKFYEVEVLKEFDDLLEEHEVVCRVTGKVFGEVLGICEDHRVLVKIEEWFVKSDEWKLGTWWAASRGETRLDPA